MNPKLTDAYMRQHTTTLLIQILVCHLLVSMPMYKINAYVVVGNGSNFILVWICQKMNGRTSTLIAAIFSPTRLTLATSITKRTTIVTPLVAGTRLIRCPMTFEAVYMPAVNLDLVSYMSFTNLLSSAAPVNIMILFPRFAKWIHWLNPLNNPSSQLKNTVYHADKKVETCAWGFKRNLEIWV